jgi:hypothetical protein
MNAYQSEFRRRKNIVKGILNMEKQIISSLLLSKILEPILIKLWRVLFFFNHQNMVRTKKKDT